MARLAYECNLGLRFNSTEELEAIRSYTCSAEKSYCLYCCCNPQCCLLIQRRPPKHFWEAWYFWLGIALLLLLILSSISSYVVSNCRHSFHTSITIGRNIEIPTISRSNRVTGEMNEISVHVVPATDVTLSTPRIKVQLAAPQPNITHMSKLLILYR
ncbi:uncharacterized protein [Chelonus insularis]|uniref:uncharacterized protein n=1 Tax=Chelonus insularis TaxID=460826 RepID=UPI00158A0215|nr:uncharacterized protein LOC118064265 [Chelonus insularis]